MITRLVVAIAIAILGCGHLAAQVVPVSAKKRTTIEITVPGKGVQTSIQEGFFYRASNGSLIVRARTRDEKGNLGDVVSADLTDKEHNIEYKILYEKHVAMVIPAFMVRYLAAPADEPAPPGGFEQNAVEGIPCERRPVRLNAKGKPQVELGYSCVSRRYGDLELRREVTEAKSGRTTHWVSELYDIKLGTEPDPKLFDLKNYTIMRLPEPNPQAAGASPAADPLSEGKAAIMSHDYEVAKKFFTRHLADHPADADALFLAGNVFLELKDYESAVQSYLAAIRSQPPYWSAHRNLVIAYAAEGKWSDFDQERALLQDARGKTDAGSKPTDVDIIDVLYVGAERYVVRSYAALHGKFKARYNVSHIGSDGEPDYWIECESDDNDQTKFAMSHPKEAAAGLRSFSLDFYAAPVLSPDGKSTINSHGTIAFYPDGEPPYETVRSDVLEVLKKRASPIISSTTLTTVSGTPDAVTTPAAAIFAAKRAWESIYEKAASNDVYSKQITAKFEPYTATLQDGIWIVVGTVPSGYHGQILLTRVFEYGGKVQVISSEVKKAIPGKPGPADV